jgi:hypothetical protein
MLPFLRQLFSPSYLYAQQTQPWGIWGDAHLFWAAFFAVVGLAGWRKGQRWLVTLSAGGLLALILYRHSAGPFSARVWYLAALLALLVGGGGAALWRVRWPRGAKWLAPLLFPALAWGGRMLLEKGLGLDIAPYAAFPYPDPWWPWFDLRAMTLAGGMTALLLLPPVRRAPRLLGGGMLALGLAWFGTLIARHLSHGAAGSDPFCYLQMAADLVERGTPQHVFPLVERVRALGLSTWPVVHVGYHSPFAGTLAPTVWPLGWPLLLAPFYALGGEAGALLAAPVFAVGAALLTGALALEAAPTATSARARYAVAGLAALLTLTSTEALLRALVPMGDAAATLLAVLTLLCLWRAQRRDRLRWSILAGLALAGGYFVRHPQLMLAFAALPLLGVSWPPRRRLAHLLALSGAALLGALPDLAYHTAAFGAPWRSESAEWALLSVRNIPASAWALLLDGGLRREEYGYLWPLAGYGAWALWRAPQARRFLAMMALGGGGVLLFSLSYRAVRPRDLLALLPLFNLVAAWGALALWQRRRTLAQVAVVVMLAARLSAPLGLLGVAEVRTFGHLSAAQRASYAALGQSLPARAVVGTGLSSGAVERYAMRETVRSAGWSAQEVARLATALQGEGRALYLLVDGKEMEEWLRAAAEVLPVQAVGSWPLPCYGRGGEEAGDVAVLYKVVANH